jgi:hypothetical protein
MDFNAVELLQKPFIAYRNLYKLKNVIKYDNIIFFYRKIEDEIYFDFLIRRNHIALMRLICVDSMIYLLFGILVFFRLKCQIHHGKNNVFSFLSFETVKKLYLFSFLM